MINTKDSWLLNAACIVSLGYILTLSITDSHVAYGYEDADVQRLLKTNNCKNCDLQGADLSGIKLDRAFLRYAEMQEANLEGAQMTFADFIAANMRKAKLNGANLSETNLRGTDMRDARLSGTNLSNADVQGADFMWAKGLTGKQKAYLRENGAKNVPE